MCTPPHTNIAISVTRKSACRTFCSNFPHWLGDTERETVLCVCALYARHTLQAIPYCVVNVAGQRASKNIHLFAINFWWWHRRVGGNNSIYQNWEWEFLGEHRTFCETPIYSFSRWRLGRCVMRLPQWCRSIVCAWCLWWRSVDKSNFTLWRSRAFIHSLRLLLPLAQCQFVFYRNMKILFREIQWRLPRRSRPLSNCCPFAEVGCCDQTCDHRQWWLRWQPSCVREKRVYKVSGVISGRQTQPGVITKQTNETFSRYRSRDKLVCRQCVCVCVSGQKCIFN